MRSLLLMIVVSILDLLFSNVHAQKKWNFEQLEYSRIYAVGDMHLDQIKLRKREKFHHVYTDSSASYEYQLIYYLVKERNARYIFIELPVNFQLYIDLFFESGEYGELLKCFSPKDRHILKKLDYLRLIKGQFPELKVLCAEAGAVDQNLFYSTNLFYQICNQVLGHDTARLVIEWNTQLFLELYESYDRQVDSIFTVHNDFVLHDLLKKSVKNRFLGSPRPEQNLVELSNDWLKYLRGSPNANKYFGQKDKIIELIEWYLAGAENGSKILEKQRDSLITKFVSLKIEEDSSAAILLFGNVHVSPAWSFSSNIYHRFEKLNWQPVVVELCYPNYPYYFHPKGLKRKIQEHPSANGIIRFHGRWWGMKVD